MTFKEAALKQLVDGGFDEAQAQEVLTRLMNHPANAAMQGRWNNDVMDSGPAGAAVLRVAVCTEAVEYIDEKMPGAWFRACFA